MIASPRSTLHWVLVWGTAAGLAGIPAEMAAQPGPGQQRGRLGAWLMEARTSSFHASIQADAMANPVGAHVSRAGVWASHRVPAGMPAGPETAVSPGRIFVSTLAGAAVPLAPLMVYWHYVLEELPLGDARGELDLGLTSIATLLTVPMAAGMAGVDSLGRTMIGTGLGFILGHMAISGNVIGYGTSWFARAPPVFALTMAAVTTLAITIREGE